MTSKAALATAQAQLEFKRMAMDEARRKGNKALYNTLRDEVDTLVTRMQKTGVLGCLALEDGTDGALDLEGGK